MQLLEHHLHRDYCGWTFVQQYRRTFVGKVMSLLFNMLSRLVIIFLPRSKHLLNSWLQSPSAVILLLLLLSRFSRVHGSPPGSPISGILQARILESVAISFSNAWKWKVKGKSLSCVWLFATPWTAAYQVPSSMGFSRQEYEWLKVIFLDTCDIHILGTRDSKIIIIFCLQKLGFIILDYKLL